MTWSKQRSPESIQHKRMIDSAKWKKYSREYRKRNPLCVMCGGPAEHVDHKVEPRGDRRLFWSPRNHQSVCRDCHVSKTHAERSGKPMRGCDENGNPLDPNDDWWRDPASLRDSRFPWASFGRRGEGAAFSGKKFSDAAHPHVP